MVAQVTGQLTARFEWPRSHLARCASGLTVVTTELSHLHSVAIGLFVRCGSRFEDARESGLSHLLEHVLFRGTEAHPSAYDFNSAIERYATGIEGATYRDFTTFEAVCHPAALTPTLELMAEFVSASLLADVEVERRVVLEEIQDDLEAVGREVNLDSHAKRTMFPASGFGQRIGGLPRSVSRLDRADCERWYRRHYVAQNMVLTVAGPVDHERVAAEAARSFRGLRPGKAIAPPPAAPRDDLPALEYVQRGGSQTELQLAVLAPGLGHPDWPALHLAHKLFDDGSCGRLRRRLVDELGLAYHVAAELEVYEGLSLFVVEVAVTHDKAVTVFDEISAALAGLAHDEAGDEEWSRVRDRMAFDLMASVDAPTWMAGREGMGQLYGPAEPLGSWYERVMEVTTAEVAAAVRRHLGTGAAQLTIVGELQPTERAALRRRIRNLSEVVRS